MEGSCFSCRADAPVKPMPQAMAHEWPGVRSCIKTTFYPLRWCWRCWPLAGSSVGGPRPGLLSDRQPRQVNRPSRLFHSTPRRRHHRRRPNRPAIRRRQPPPYGWTRPTTATPSRSTSPRRRLRRRRFPAQPLMRHPYRPSRRRPAQPRAAKPFCRSGSTPRQRPHRRRRPQRPFRPTPPRLSI